MAIDIRSYKEDDIEAIQSLFSISFNGHITKEWFRWKYERSPWGTRGYIAFHDGNAAAFYGGLRMRFDYKGKHFWAYQLCDVMTHPDYRGKIFSKTPLIAMLGELLYKENEMDFAFGFPSLRHAKLQALRLGGEGYRLIRLYKKDEIKKRRFSLFELNIVEGWHMLDSLSFKQITKSSGDGLRLVKDIDYINWRYVEHPLKKYHLLTFKRFGSVKGFVVFNVEDQAVNVIELFYDSINSLKGIISSFEDYMANRVKLNCVKLWLHPKDKASAIFEQSGYAYHDHIPIAFKPVNKECGVDSEVFYDGFYYSMGDYDAS